MKGYDEGYAYLKIGITLRDLREKAGLTQKSAISRIENHAEAMRISTLYKIASVSGKHVNITIR